MDAELLTTIYLFRGVERVIIQIGAIACIVAGTLLYRWGVKGTTGVSGEGLGVKFELKNAAPGTVLALFGMVVMAVALRNPAKVESGDRPPLVAPSPSPSNGPGPGGSVKPPQGGGQVITYSVESGVADPLFEALQNETVTETEPREAIAVLEKRSDEAKRLLAKDPTFALLGDLVSVRPASDDEARKLLGSFRARAKRLR